MIAFKFLRPQGLAIFSGHTWQAPAAGQVGEWVETNEGPLVPCVNGIHASAPEDLAFWLADELWEVELDGEIIEGPQAIIARRGRLVRKVEAWNAATALELGKVVAQRASDALDRAGDAAPERARAYLREVQGFLDRGDGVVASYAAALAVSAVDPQADANAAFQGERREQSRVLAQMLKL